MGTGKNILSGLYYDGIVQNGENDKIIFSNTTVTYQSSHFS